MKVKFLTAKPVEERLQSAISYYYFHSTEDSSYRSKFVYYPNSKNALTAYKNAKIIYEHGGSESVPDQAINCSFLYSGIQKVSRTAKIVGPFDKVGVVFSELGINHFIEVPLCEILTDDMDMSFSYFEPDGSGVFEHVFHQPSIAEKVKILDSFFLERWRGFWESRLIDSVQFILNSSKKISVNEVAEHVEVNKKTLLRIFRKHLCCTPKDFINIVQFRRALENYLSKENGSSLTELALDTDYYDQAQFINHFKKLTDINPKFFFNSIEHLGKEGTFWMFK